MSNQRYTLPANHTEDSVADLDFMFTPILQNGDQHPLGGRLLYLSTAKYEQDWNCSVHAHNFSELFFITGGKGFFMAKGRKFPIERSQLVIINPHVEHAEFSSRDQPLEYMVLGIDGLQFTPMVPSDSPVIHIPQPHPKIEFYMNALRDEMQLSLYGHEAVCQNLLNIILLLILRHKEIRVSITAYNDVSAECIAVKDYIDAHFKDPITLELLAQQAHQNKYYIAHTFKDAFGISPIKYLMERRVEESKYLLDETDFSISQIASIIGFSSSSHYSQAFRRLTDMSPNEYRKKFRNPASLRCE